MRKFILRKENQEKRVWTNKERGDFNDEEKYKGISLRILYVLVFLSLAIPMYLVIRDNNHNENQLERQQKVDRQLAKFAIEQQKNRIDALEVICLNEDGQNRALRGMIIAGAQVSKPFEDLFRKYGIPSYKKRLQDAERSALLLPIVKDCREAARRSVINNEVDAAFPLAELERKLQNK